jgi:hypothetical protein
MKTFLQIEYLKIKGNNSFKVFTLLFIVFLPLLVIVMPLIFKDGLLQANSYPLMPKTFDSSWYFTSYVASWFSLFILSFIIIFHITNEYSARTVRQNIIDGYSKFEFLKSKLIMVLFMAIVATLYVFLIGLIAGFIFESKQGSVAAVSAMPGMPPMAKGVVGYGNMFDGLIFVGGFFIQIVAYFILAVLISIWIKKGALAVIAYFAIFPIEKIFVWQFNANEMENVTQFFPLNSISSLLPNLDPTFFVFGLGDMEPMNLVSTLVSVFYIILFLWLIKFIFYRRDVG